MDIIVRNASEWIFDHSQVFNQSIQSGRSGNRGEYSTMIRHNTAAQHCQDECLPAGMSDGVAPIVIFVRFGRGGFYVVYRRWLDQSRTRLSTIGCCPLRDQLQAADSLVLTSNATDGESLPHQLPFSCHSVVLFLQGTATSLSGLDHTHV